MDGAPGSRASVIASPVLVGAVTVLIVIVGVYLAYNANNGLPFVPTYDVKAELPNAQKLIAGNEIRLGGFRVGVGSDIRPGMRDGRTVAVVDMKLDKTVEALAADPVIGGRARPAPGLKSLDTTRGRSKASLRPGDTIPLAQARTQAVEYEDVFS